MIHRRPAARGDGRPASGRGGAPADRSTTTARHENTRSPAHKDTRTRDRSATGPSTRTRRRRCGCAHCWTPTPSGLRLLGGEDELDRTVRGVMTTDLRDPSRYLTGGELVLTGLAWRHGPDDSEPFVRHPGRRRGGRARRGRGGARARSRRTWWRRAYGTGCRCSRSTSRWRSPRSPSTWSGRSRASGPGDLAAVVDRHRRLMSSGPGRRRPGGGARPARQRPGPAGLGAVVHRPGDRRLRAPAARADPRGAGRRPAGGEHGPAGRRRTG